jgi:GH15 family glucan-1,4-alpha-glucosidase
MAWVALDRGIRAIEECGLDGPAERWRAVRRAIHQEIGTRGFDRELGSFVQSYGSKHNLARATKPAERRAAS